MVLLSEMHVRVKKDEKFVLDIKKSVLDTGKMAPDLYRDFKNVEENQHFGFDPSFQEEESNIRKRKRQCCLPMLNWICNLAKSPCDPEIEPLPDFNKWKCYGSELPWKQILLTREILRRKIQTSPQQSPSQKIQKMHPSMYDDNQSSNERVRCSQRMVSAKDPSRKASDHLSPESSSSGSHDDESSDDKQSDDAGFWFVNHRRKRKVRLGLVLQADLPESCGVNYSSDPKWLGTKVWPLEKSEHNRCLIERDPIGKGRSESCGCEFPGNNDCVTFHIREKKMKTMLELHSAFYSWEMDKMGEYVALTWTKEDENKFRDTVEMNRLSSEKSFWDELFRCFSGKGREALVSYYFNVFLVRRRSVQNRSNTSDIYSDDEESETGPVASFGHVVGNSSESIFCSPQKAHSNTR